MATRPDLILGTRGSALALWQTHHVAALLRAAHPALQVVIETFRTSGDRIVDTPLPLLGGKGLFTQELEAALSDGRIDCAVHSLKDLPTALADGLAIGALPARANPADALISRVGRTLAALPHGARVGTSSLRRAAQLRRARPDLQLADIRGNVDTRLRKALDPAQGYDAIVLACAGLERLGHAAAITAVLDFETMLPAPGQGAIAVQARADADLLALLAPIHHAPTALAVTAERAFLAALGGGCALPIAALADWQGRDLLLRGRVLAPDGSRQLDIAQRAPAPDEAAARALGEAAARAALAQGARALLEPQP